MVGSGVFVYPPLEMVKLFYVPPMVVQKFPPLVVLDILHLVLLMTVPPFDLHQVCSVGLKKGLQVVLGIPTGFYQCVQMMLQDLDVVMTPLNLQQPERRNHQKI